MMLNENIQLAKKVLKEVGKTEDDSKFLELKKLVGNSTGYIGFVTTLFYKKRVSIEKIKEILKKIKENRTLIRYLPFEIVKYVDLEKLEDDLNKLKEWQIYNKDFVGKLSSKFKESAKQDEDLKIFWTSLEDEQKKQIEYFLTKQIRYKEYDDFKKDIIVSLSKNKDEIIDLIDETEGIYIVYDEDDILVAEVWGKEASIKLGSKSWCISGNDASYWNNYINIQNLNKQYFLWNFRVSESDNDSQLGTTINPDGSQKATHLKDDRLTDLTYYLKKYNIPKDIFKPLDFKKEHKNVIKYYGGLTNKSVSLLYENDLLELYRDKLQYRYLIIYELITKEEIDKLEISDIKKQILMKNKNEFIEGLIEFILNFETNDLDSFVSEKKDHIYIKTLREMDFVDRINLLYNFDLKDEFDKTHMYLLFYFEDDTYSIDFDIDYYTFDFLIDIDENDFIYEVLNITDDLYHSLKNLNPNYIDFRNNLDSQESNYLSYHFSDNIVEKLIEVINLKIENTSSNELKEYLKDEIENIKNKQEFDSFLIESNIDGLEDLFDDYLTEMCLAAEELAIDDFRKFEDNIIGEFNTDIWKLDLDQIIEIFDKKGLIEGTLLDFINSSPNDISDISYNFIGDLPYSYSSYDFNIDKINQNLYDDLENLIDRGYYDNDLTLKEEFKILSDKEINLLKAGFNLVEFDKSYYKKEFIWYKKLGKEIYFILNNDINIDVPQKIDVYVGSSDIEYKDVYEIKNLKKINMKISISEIEVKDPNQLEFKFEHICSFYNFKQKKYF
jgi:hypothetical protein